MKVKIFSVNPFEMNCYIYYDENSKEGIIIDPAAYSDTEKYQIINFISQEEIKIKFILNTHGHIDHILGNHWAKESFNVPIYMHKNDLELVTRAVEQGALFGLTFQRPPEPDGFLEENQELKIDNCKLKILHTPGHSPGSVCFIDENEKIIFGGDCVFENSIGRTDLWKGDMETLMNSIKNKIFRYADEFTIYPGHYGSTTIGEERLNNPFLTNSYYRF